MLAWDQRGLYKVLRWEWTCLLCGRGGELEVRRPEVQDILLVDLYEPVEMSQLLSQAIPTERLPLNRGGYADYMWPAGDGHMVQVERKHWTEVLSDLDHVEEQLRRELDNAQELALLVEGVVEPTGYGVDVYQKAEGKPYFVRRYSYGTANRPQPSLYSRVLSWLWQLDKSGVTVYWTPDLTASAMALVAYYKQSQKSEHSTLRRYIKPKVQPRQLDPQVLSLMGIVGAEIGEQRAKALVAEFGSVFNVLCAEVGDLESVPGMGPAAARKLLKAVGRE